MRLIKFCGLGAIILLCLSLFVVSKIDSRKLPPTPDNPIPAEYSDKSLFLSAIKQTPVNPSQEIITGITVPHHLLAINLIAKAFDFASSQKISQVLIMSPDHFNLGDTNISTSLRNFSTIFGELNCDSQSVQQIEKLPLVHDEDFFYREHGIEAELPFIKYYFPNAKIIVIAIKESTPKDQLDSLTDKLEQVLASDSLVVQSTDFSHYLPPADAALRDQQTIDVLKNANPAALFTLNEPANIDSIGSQYIQMRLQNELFQAKFNLLDHKNSQDYTSEKVESSTSYIVQAYLK